PYCPLPETATVQAPPKCDNSSTLLMAIRDAAAAIVTMRSHDLPTVWQSACPAGLPGTRVRHLRGVLRHEAPRRNPMPLWLRLPRRGAGAPAGHCGPPAATGSRHRHTPRARFQPAPVADFLSD